MATPMWSRVLRQGCRRLNRSNGLKLRRAYCSGTSQSGSILDVPLTQTPPGIPIPRYTTVTNHKNETHVTTLENGMRVATENKFGHFCTLGVLIDSGSRYEVAYPSGISHFLEKLGFCTTTNFANRDEILQTLETHGGICDCQSSRDTLIYAMSLETRGLEKATDILSDVCLRPVITPQELEGAQQAIGYELESLDLNPNPEMLLMEMLHMAAYRDNTLGLPKICPKENINLIDKKTLYTYLKNFHTPERMVLAGVGMEHDQLVELAREYFVKKKTPIWTEDKSLIDQSKADDRSVAQYTGGKILVEKDLSNVSLGPTPMPELAHLVIGLESCSQKDDDFIAFCVLNMMMGGGGSFSAGGPGKGMYTRLYLNVLNRYHWIYSATAFNHAYEDGGVFCIHASASPDQNFEEEGKRTKVYLRCTDDWRQDPSRLGNLTEVIVKELINTTKSIETEELNRAKTQLQSMLLMNLETRPVMFEDVGRQVLSQGFRHQPQYYYDAIGKITCNDIHRVATRMLKSKPAIAAYGTLTSLPSYENIQESLLNKDRKTRWQSLFSR